MDYLRFLLVLTIVLLIVQNGEALRCWSCNSNVETGCADPFLRSANIRADLQMFTMECKGGPLQLLPNGTLGISRDNIGPGLELFCLKMSGKILGVTTVVRVCGSGFHNLTETSCMGSDPGKVMGGYIETCEACAGDLCNWATKEGPRAAVALLVPLLLTLT